MAPPDVGEVGSLPPHGRLLGRSFRHTWWTWRATGSLWL